MYKAGTKFKVVGENLPKEVKEYFGLIGFLTNDYCGKEGYDTYLRLKFEDMHVNSFLPNELQIVSDVS